MWSLGESKDRGCTKTRDGLEETAGRRPHPSTVEEWTDELPAEARAHMLTCMACREAAQDLLTTRKLFGGVARTAKVDRPFFAARVMAAIAAREKELAQLVSPWAEVPRFAARLTWITAVLLLAGSTWFYRKTMTSPMRSSGGDAGQESIFEAPPPANPDDVLISMELHP